MPINRSLSLIGFKHCGKSSVAQALAQQTGMQYLDTDRLIEQRHPLKLSVRAIYQQQGEAVFRALEKAVIHSLSGHQQVIATGGGSLLDPTNSVHLKSLGPCVYLATPYEVLLQRLKQQALPAYLSQDALEQDFFQLYQQRKVGYEQAADLTILTADQSFYTIAERIIFELRLTTL